MDMEHKALVDN